jgi:hypothetical protein
MGKVIEIRANGKLLLTGEYLVLAGATALAMPTRFGQSMQVANHSDQELWWTSREQGRTWFTARFDPHSLNIIETSADETSVSLQQLLLAAVTLNPDCRALYSGSAVTMDANYPLGWGLGSSSSLIYLVAQWTGINPYRLFREVSGGSGYDVACAGQFGLLFYQLSAGEPFVAHTSAGRALQEHACFGYLGKKQDTRREVDLFLNHGHYTATDIKEVSACAYSFVLAETATELMQKVEEHEAILSRILGKPPVATRFLGFSGAVKSLGAWGGDFAMFVSPESHFIVKKELKRFGIEDVFTFAEIIAHP